MCLELSIFLDRPITYHGFLFEGYDVCSGRLGSKPSIFPATPSASAGQQRASFTEYVSGSEHSVTRLGNPSSMVPSKSESHLALRHASVWSTNPIAEKKIM